MPQRRLLYLDANQLAAYLWQSSTLREEGRFGTTSEGVEAFTRYVRHHADSVFYLMADVPEEGFQFESVPYVQGKDRRALLARKLGQMFYGSPLSTALSQGRDKDGRRDEKILFAALTRPQSFEPWLTALRLAEARLAGIYSLPLVSAALLRRAVPKLERCLLVSVAHGGIRQSFFEDGKLRFSRLSPLVHSSAAELAKTCAAEAAKTHHYLDGQRLFARSTSLPVLVLVHPAQQAGFAEHCRSSEELQFELLDLHAVARTCGLHSALPDSLSEQLFLHLLVRDTPREQFAPPAERRFFRLWQARFALLGSGALALAGCLLFAGAQLYELSVLRDDAVSALAQSRNDEHHYATMMSALPPMPTSLDKLRAVVSRYDELERRSVPLETLLARISTAVQDAPAVEIERIDWMLSGNPEDGLDPQDAHRTAAPSAPMGQRQADDNGIFSIAIVNSVLPMPPGDQRSLLEAVDQFVALLRRDAGLRVTVLRLPFDIESGKALRSSADAALAREPAHFTVRVSYKL